MYHVKLYLGSWVLRPMEQALKEDRNKVKRNEQKRHREANKRKKEWLKKHKAQQPFLIATNAYVFENVAGVSRQLSNTVFQAGC